MKKESIDIFYLTLWKSHGKKFSLEAIFSFCRAFCFHLYIPKLSQYNLFEWLFILKRSIQFVTKLSHLGDYLKLIQIDFYWMCFDHFSHMKKKFVRNLHDQTQWDVAQCDVNKSVWRNFSQNVQKYIKTKIPINSVKVK